MSLAAPNSTEYIEKVALEHCRWYFARDVRIITVRQPLAPDRNTPASSGQQITLADRRAPTSIGQRFIAIVIPVAYSLMFLQGLEDEILLQVEVSDTEGGQKASRDLVLQKLLDVVQTMIGNSLSLRGN